MSEMILQVEDLHVWFDLWSDGEASVPFKE